MYIQLRDEVTDKHDDVSTVRQFWIKVDLVEVFEDSVFYKDFETQEWISIEKYDEGWSMVAEYVEYNFDFMLIRPRLNEGCKEGLMEEVL